MGRRAVRPWWSDARQQWGTTYKGKQIWLGSDKAEAYRLFHELHASRWNPTAVVPVRPGTSPRVASLVAAFREHCEREESAGNLSAATLKDYLARLESFLARWPGLRFAELKYFHVDAWIQGHPSWGPASVRNSVGALQHALSWCIGRGHVDGRNPLDGYPLPSVQPRDVLLTAEQVAILFDNASGSWLDFLTAMRFTGARVHEVRIVEARHCSPDFLRWSIPWNEQPRNKRHRKKPKARVIPLVGPMPELCRRLAAEHPTGPLFHSSRGRPWLPNAIGARMRRLRATYPELPPTLCATHFRHLAITAMLEAGVPVSFVQQVVGHASSAMIETIYSQLHKQTDLIREAAERGLA